MKDWWKADLNGVEVARGTWAEVMDDLPVILTQRIAGQEPGPKSFIFDIRRAQTITAPDRRRRPEAFRASPPIGHDGQIIKGRRIA